MYGYGYRYNSGLVVGAGGGAPFLNTYSLDFDGVDDYVDCGNISELNGVTEASWSIWAAKNGTSDYYLMSCYSSTSSLRQYLFQQYSDKLYVYLSNSGGTLRLMNRIDYIFNIDEWYHIGIVYNEAELSNADKVKIYINGTLQTNQTTGFALTSLRSTTASTNIGRAVDFTTKEYNGKIDEVAIFDSALTPTEITSISSAPTDLSLLSTPPIAWYRMGDNGSYKSPQWLLPNNENKDKVSNYSFEFDGVDDYIDCGDSDIFSFGDGATDSAFSVSSWFKMSSFNTNNVVFSKDSGLPNREYAIGFFGTSQKLRFYIKNQGGNSQQSIDSTTLFALDTWYNVVCTYDGSGGSNAADGMKIYVNSVLETPTNIIKGTYVAMSNTTAPINIGRYGAAASPLPATVDEVSVYDSELLQADVTDIYNGGEPTTISGAIAHWRMGEDASFSTNWTVPDAVGSNDGTSNAMNIFDRVGEAPSSENNALSYNMDLVDRVTDVP